MHPPFFQGVMKVEKPFRADKFLKNEVFFIITFETPYILIIIYNRYIIDNQRVLIYY